MASMQARIIPNPMKNQAQIVVEGITPDQKVEFTLYNVVGKVVFTTTLSSVNTTLDRNSLTPGMYIYVIKGKEINSNGKLVIE
jgi:hypothetical protein